jgi:hypothetical protein
MTRMPNRTKRTYNLSERTVRRVRELAEDYGTAKTQDGVVDLAVERLYLEQQQDRETAQWATAATDPEFRREVAEIEGAFDVEAWPE